MAALPSEVASLKFVALDQDDSGDKVVAAVYGQAAHIWEMTTRNSKKITSKHRSTLKNYPLRNRVVGLTEMKTGLSDSQFLTRQPSSGPGSQVDRNKRGNSGHYGRRSLPRCNWPRGKRSCRKCRCAGLMKRTKLNHGEPIATIAGTREFLNLPITLRNERGRMSLVWRSRPFTKHSAGELNVWKHDSFVPRPLYAREYIIVRCRGQESTLFRNMKALGCSGRALRGLY